MDCDSGLARPRVPSLIKEFEYTTNNGPGHLNIYAKKRQVMRICRAYALMNFIYSCLFELDGNIFSRSPVSYLFKYTRSEQIITSEFVSLSTKGYF